MKVKTIAVLFSLGMMLAAQTARAVSGYVGMIPNGSSFSCANCHVDPAGGGTRTQFGSDFANNGHAWNAALAALDSDGDGYKNGAELGDPNGTWVAGQANPAGPVYNPGSASSHPTVTATAPAITTQPVSQTVTAGANVTFTVAATGTAPLSYQWMKGGVNISGATSATLTLTSVTTASAGSYTVKVSNSAGSVTSAAATLTVNAAAVAPAITTQPVSQTVTAGANVTFTVAATGTAPLSYQWMKGGVNISGATSATLTLTSVTTASAGSYTVKVSNSAGSVTSAAATLTVNAAAVAPAITTQPVSQTVTAGANVTFTVAATGTAPLSYQWMKGGVNISGATSATLTLTSVTTASAGSYTVKVSNSAGSVTSAAATLTVNAAAVAPAITTQPVSQTVTAGANVTFTVAATGTAPLSYQWMKGGVNISGATSATLTLSSVTTASTGSYTVKVSNSAGSVTSAAATLTVNPVVATLSVTLTSPINGTSFTAPADVALAATVSPAQNIAGVEFFDGTNLLGEVTTAPYSMIASNLPAGDHVIVARVTDNSGATAVSTAVDITVTAPVSGNPPVVKLLSPRADARYYAPTRIVMVASVTDASSAIKSVAFYVDGTFVGAGRLFSQDDDSSAATSKLYYGVATGLSIGQHTVTAKATAMDGTVGASAPVQIIVTTQWIRRSYDD